LRRINQARRKKKFWSPLDHLYQRITTALDRLLHALGLTFSPSINETKSSLKPHNGLNTPA
jgi:hypothetical protein